MGSTLRILFLIFICFTGADYLHAQNDTKLEREYEQFEVFTKALFYLESLYVDDNKVKRHSLVENALKGMVSGLDPHSIYFPKSAFKKFTTDTSGHFGGVGIIVQRERKKLIVISAIEDTPAYKAGVKTGDEIVKIDSKKLSDLSGQDPLLLLKGKIGSTLTIEVKRKNSKNIVFRLRRELIKVKSVKKFALAEQFSLIRISSFQQDTFTELASILKTIQNSSSGIILDLRGNPGGLLDKAVEIADLFIESGIIISTVGRDKNKAEREFAKKRGTYSDLPVIVLLDRGSASAAEVVAGALQDYKRAFIVGEKSFGKGSVQSLISLPDGSGIKMTVAKYYTPLDRSIHGVGIKPDKKIMAIAKQSPEAMLARLQDETKIALKKNTLSSWPNKLSGDAQVVAAYLYLQEWALKQQKNTPATVPTSFY